MSAFWRYFHDKLGWLPIFRPGPLSALVKGLALHMDDCRQDILWLREQWLAEKAGADLVPGYGESRGMLRFRFDTDESYRKRVVNAFAWHQLGGKTRGLERIFAENGLIAEVANSPDPELWAHFRVRIKTTDMLFGLEALEMSFWLANEFKPARSVLEGVWTWGETRLNRYFAAAMRSLTTARPQLYFVPPRFAPLRQYPAPGARSLTVSRLQFCSMPAQCANLPRKIAACSSGKTTTALRLFFPGRQIRLALCCPFP